MYRYCFVVWFLVLFGFSARGTTESPSVWDFDLKGEYERFNKTVATHLPALETPDLPARETLTSLVDGTFFKILKDEYPFITFDDPETDFDITEHMSHAGYIPQSYTADPMILGEEEHPLCTHQLANCLGVAIYNTETKQRSLWHFHAFGNRNTFQTEVVDLIEKVKGTSTNATIQITGVTGFLTDLSILYVKLLTELFPAATIQLRAYEQLREYRKKDGVTGDETSVLLWFSSEKQKDYLDHKEYGYTHRALAITPDGRVHYGRHDLTLGKFPYPRPSTKPDTLTDDEWGAYERQLDQSSFHSKPVA